MKKPLFILWLLVPVGVIAWHYGPGQAQLRRDFAGDKLRAARAAAAAEDWGRAAELYGEAAKALPEESVADRQRLQLAQATHRVRAGELIEGQEQLEELLSDLESGEDRDPVLTASVRHELAAGLLHRLADAVGGSHRGGVEAGSGTSPPAVPLAGRAGRRDGRRPGRRLREEPGGHHSPGTDGPERVEVPAPAEKLPVSMQESQPAETQTVSGPLPG